MATIQQSNPGDSRPGDVNLQKGKNFVQETITELKKTTWPTREEALRLTYVVIGVIIVLGLYMGLLDATLSWLVSRFHLLG